MRDVTVTCCRCGHVIESDGSVLEATSGPIRRRRGPRPIDLCRPCVSGLLAWLEAPSLPTLEPTEFASSSASPRDLTRISF